MHSEEHNKRAVRAVSGEMSEASEARAGVCIISIAMLQH